jgi:undecaprenyl-phosphate 4-deoxy-4-formamido-L-arabinose transferase
MTPALSFVIPLYNCAETLTPLVQAIEALSIDGGHEIVLVNDGSVDGTAAIARGLVRAATIPVVFVDHARNFGEHNAVLTGWRHARGQYVVNLDDDGQNPPDEAVRLWRHAVEKGLDVVFGHYAVKQHAAWRNLGSWFTNKMTDWALDKPAGFYLSSFRCVSAFVVKQATSYAGPYPYLDGLLLQTTQRIGSIDVRHDPRQAGRSGYTIGRLVRLWTSAWINASVLPLRAATVLGLLTAFAGLAALGGVLWLRFSNRGPAYGWGSVMATVLIFAGTQLVMLGLIGEYLGRLFLTVNQRPQAVIREVLRSTTPP